jgi:hypothetical protein
MDVKEISAIACGRKTALLIKKRPSLFEMPFKIYFYEKKGKLSNRAKIGYTAFGYEGRGLVVGECVCHSFRTSDVSIYDNKLKKDLCMTAREFTEFFDCSTGYIFFFDEVKIYDKPRTLGEFGKKRPPQAWYHIDEGERRAYQ